MKTNSLTVSKIKLSLEEQVELGKRMTLFGDMEARETLILNCVPIVIEASKKFSYHENSSYDDLFQEGMMGVMEAIEKYDYTRNVKFSTFAYCRIIHNLALWTKKHLKTVSPGVNENVTDGLILDSTIETFQAVYQTYPTDSQLTKLLSMPSSEIAYLKKHHSNPVPSAFRMCSYEDLYAVPGSTADVSVIVEKMMCKEYNLKHLFNAIQTLDDLERDIILRRYLYNDERRKATLEEIANDHCIHASTVLRRERKALQKIMDYFTENNIQPEL